MTFSKAGLEKFSILKNHCIDNLGSMTTSVLSEKPTLLTKLSTSTKCLVFSNS